MILCFFSLNIKICFILFLISLYIFFEKKKRGWISYFILDLIGFWFILAYCDI